MEKSVLKNKKHQTLLKNDKIDKKFDIDGDGKLDDAEKAAAEKYKESLKDAELMKKFDIDGNGELDSSEKAAYDAYNDAKAEKEKEKQPIIIDEPKFPIGGWDKGFVPSWYEPTNKKLNLEADNKITKNLEAEPEAKAKAEATKSIAENLKKGALELTEATKPIAENLKKSAVEIATDALGTLKKAVDNNK